MLAAALDPQRESCDYQTVGPLGHCRLAENRKSLAALIVRPFLGHFAARFCPNSQSHTSGVLSHRSDAYFVTPPSTGLSPVYLNAASPTLCPRFAISVNFILAPIAFIRSNVEFPKLT